MRYLPQGHTAVQPNAREWQREEESKESQEVRTPQAAKEGGKAQEAAHKESGKKEDESSQEGLFEKKEGQEAKESRKKEAKAASCKEISKKKAKKATG